MFEDATIESSGRLGTRSKYYTLFGALFNGTLLAAMILVPLLHPEALPRNALSAVLVAPPPPPPLPPPTQVQAARAMPRVAQLSELLAPRQIPTRMDVSRDTPQPPTANPGAEGLGSPSASSSTGLADLIGCCAATPVVRAPVPNKVAISGGVMAGSLLAKTPPAYPAIARAARIAGTVILSATISRTGSIENLTIISGPAMLTQAALDAVRTWRYRPYQLNGQPVEVQTTVNVTFTLGG